MGTSSSKSNIPTNLLCVKSIITIVISIAFSILCFLYPDDYTDTMKMIIVSVITFYFSHQTDKSNTNKNKEGEAKNGKQDV